MTNPTQLALDAGLGTTLARDLNAAMDADVVARMAYLLEYSTGADIVCWAPLPVDGPSLVNTDATSTRCGTVPSRPR